jgi:hypothetical protein
MPVCPLETPYDEVDMAPIYHELALMEGDAGSDEYLDALAVWAARPELEAIHTYCERLPW